MNLKETIIKNIQNINLIQERSINSKTEETLSYIETMYTHILKYKYQPGKQSASWVKTIRINNYNANMMLSNNSIKRKIGEVEISKMFQKARNSAAKETGINLKIFPTEINDDNDILFEKMIDKEQLEKFMQNNAKTQEVKDYLENKRNKQRK